MTYLALQAVVDGLLPVNDVLLQVVRDHSLHGLRTELRLDLKYPAERRDTMMWGGSEKIKLFVDH